MTLTFQAADGDLEAELEREAEEALREEREAKEAKELLLREAKEEVARLKRQVGNGRRVCQKFRLKKKDLKINEEGGVFPACQQRISTVRPNCDRPKKQ